MYQALHIAKTGLAAQDVNMVSSSNNLANVNTVGFKKDRANFESLHYRNVRQPGTSTARGTESPTGLLLGNGVRVVSTEKIHAQGSFISTGNSLDLAVQGEGYFQILLPDGTIGYTRDGTFSRNANGDVVTAKGYPVEPAISIPNNTTSINIGVDGNVAVTVAGSSVAQNVGQLTLTVFPNAPGLQPIGGNLYKHTTSSGAAIVTEAGQGGAGEITQGFLESSNVSIVEEMVSMIQIQRNMDLQSKVISAVSSSMRFLLQNV